MSTLVDAIVIGLFEAAPLILAAVGFTLIFYLNRFINVAYGENLTLGAYTAVFLNTTLGLNFYLTIVPAALLTGLISVLTFLLVFGPAHRRGVGPTEMIVLSVGLAFLIRHALRLGFGLENRLFDIGRPAYLTILGVGITSVQLMALGLVVLIAIALYFFIFKTTYGQMIRGLASNEDLAQVSGIHPTRVSVLIWFIAGFTGGLAGLFYGVFSFVGSELGWNLILIIIMISIVGGIGNVRGALAAGVGAGIIVAFVTLKTEPLYAQIILLLLFIAVLKGKKVLRTAAG